MLASLQITQQSSSGDDITEKENGAYSSTVHKLIIFINGGAMGLLQVVVTNQSSTKEADRRATILCFWVIILIYTILRVCELKLRNNNPNIRNFVGHSSHLSGALAAIVLIHLISPTFMMIVVPLWIVWFFVVMYVSFSELLFQEENAADPPV